MAATDSFRSAEVRRRWTATRRSAISHQAWWTSNDLAHAGFFAGAFLTVLGTPLDLTLFFSRWAGVLYPAFSVSLPAWLVLTALVTVFAGNAVLIDRLITRKTPARHRLRRWARWLRFAISGLPMMGMLVVAGWRSLIRRQPSWFRSLLMQGAATQHRLRQIRQTYDEWVRWLEGSAFGTLWLSAANILMVLLFNLWLAGLDEVTGGLWIAMLICSGAQHVVAAIGMRHYLQRYSSQVGAHGLSRRMLRVLPRLWLLPQPIPLFILVVLLWYESDGRRARCVTYAAYFHRGSSGWSDSLPLTGLYRHLPRSLKLQPPRPVRTRPLEPPLSSVRLAALCRLKILLLGFDALALGWLGALSSNWWPALRAWPLLLLASAAAAGTPFAGARYPRPLVAPAEPAGKGLGLPPGKLLLSQLTFLFGLSCGALIGCGHLRLAGFIVFAVMITALMLLALWLIVCQAIPGRESLQGELSTAVTWCALLMALAILGGAMLVDQHAAQRLARLIGCSLFLLPIWHLLVAARLLPWLLRPYHLRDILAATTPRSLRDLLALVACITACPLGGLLMPLLVVIRDHYWQSLPTSGPSLSQSDTEHAHG